MKRRSVNAQLDGPLLDKAIIAFPETTDFPSALMSPVLFWISYPLVWIVGTPGYGIISPYTTSLLFIILPILCKPVFGIIDLYLLKSMKD